MQNAAEKGSVPRSDFPIGMCGWRGCGYGGGGGGGGGEGRMDWQRRGCCAVEGEKEEGVRDSHVK